MAEKNPTDDHAEKWEEFIKKLDATLLQQEKSSIDASSKMVSNIEKETGALCEALNVSTFETEKWVQRVETFAGKETNRLVYSIISDFVFGLDQRDHVTTNIKTAANFVLDPSNKSCTMPARKMVVKMYDHINLAIRQKEMFDRNESDRSEDMQGIVEVQVEQKSAELTKEMTTQLVSLIAIFTALSFIVFGGISSLDSIFQSLQSVIKTKNTVLPTLITAVAWALCLMNLLFGFMYFVLRITKHGEDGRKQQNIVQRYPVVFVCDFVLFSLLILFGGMWFAELHGIGRPVFDFVIKHNLALFWLFVVAFLLIFFGVGRWIYKTYIGAKRSRGATEYQNMLNFIIRNGDIKKS